jgi:hypothetical protein
MVTDFEVAVCHTDSHASGGKLVADPGHLKVLHPLALEAKNAQHLAQLRTSFLLLYCILRTEVSAGLGVTSGPLDTNSVHVVLSMGLGKAKSTPPRS